VADPLLIRHALPGERPALEALQLRASLIWEDYRENLAADPAVVRLTDVAIEEQRVRVAVVGVRAVGFSELAVVSGAEWELEGLFVEPDAMRRGIGRRLLGGLLRPRARLRGAAGRRDRRAACDGLLRAQRLRLRGAERRPASACPGLVTARTAPGVQVCSQTVDRL